RSATASSLISGWISDNAATATYSSSATWRTLRAEPSRTCTRIVFGDAVRGTTGGTIKRAGATRHPAVTSRNEIPSTFSTFSTLSTVSTSTYRKFSVIHLAFVARILVIDDDQAVRDSMARMLRGAGFTVQMAATGEEGVAAAKGNVFDVIL